MMNTIQHGDCIRKMQGMEAGSVDLVFADPPFNIGYDYDVYDDSPSAEKYLDWSRQWIGGRPSGAQAERHVLAGHRRRVCGRAEDRIAEDRLPPAAVG